METKLKYEQTKRMVQSWGKLLRGFFQNFLRGDGYFIMQIGREYGREKISRKP